ncbi:Transcription factor PIL1 [Cardamine amara subsp. amara]|uniref:Transcription factor PIL1 n=1 Tax=Cardamine amara subsp. amara TaxID=228776 RepID=A0ABD0Z3I4_CARAN
MIPPSSSFKPKLNDQDYMELVCENGQILAKSRRPKNKGSFQNQRTQSLLDLYETEYDEGFKKNIKNLGGTQVVPVGESQRHQEEENDEQTSTSKKKKKKIKSAKIEFERNVSKYNKRVESSTLINDFAKCPKSVQAITAPPDEQSAAVGRSTELYFASSSMFSLGTSRDLSCCSLRRKYGDLEEEESTYLSNNSNDESDDAQTQVPMKTRNSVKKRKRSTEDHKLSERKRRNDINKRMRALKDLLPNCDKEDKASLLDEAIKYMRTLQLQIQMMSMGNGLIQPPMMLPMSHYSPMGLGMQFLPMNVQRSGFAGINNASSPPMLSFLNHPTGLIQNSPIFSPLENCSQQFVVPSCVPQTQATSFTQFPNSVSTSDLEDAMQSRGSNGCYYRSLN